MTTRLTGRPLFVVPALVALGLVLALLFWKAGGHDTVADSRATKRFEAGQASKAAATRRAQQAAERRAAIAARAQVVRPEHRALRITFLGDWITSGAFVTKPQLSFPHLVTRWFAARMPVTVQDLGTKGITAREALSGTIPGGQDVVVVQLGTDEHFTPAQDDFNNAFPQLIDRIHQRSPHAQVLCLSPWLRPDVSSQYVATVQQACGSTQNEAIVDMSPLYAVTANRAAPGRPYFQGTVPFEGRPSDRGHLAIARAIEQMVQVVSQ